MTVIINIMKLRQSAEWIEIERELICHGDAIDKLRFIYDNRANKPTDISIDMILNHHASTQSKYSNQLVTNYLHYDEHALNILQQSGKLVIYDNYFELDISIIYLISLVGMKIVLNKNTDCKIHARYVFYDTEYRKYLATNAHRQFVDTFVTTNCNNEINYDGRVSDLYFTHKQKKVTVLINKYNRDNNIYLKHFGNYYKHTFPIDNNIINTEFYGSSQIISVCSLDDCHSCKHIIHGFNQYVYVDGLLYKINSANANNDFIYASNDYIYPKDYLDATKIWMSHTDHLRIPVELYLFTNIKELYLSHNKLIDIDLQPFTKLEKIDLSYNNLISLDISNNKQIKVNNINIKNNHVDYVKTGFLSYECV